MNAVLTFTHQKISAARARENSIENCYQYACVTTPSTTLGVVRDAIERIVKHDLAPAHLREDDDAEESVSRQRQIDALTKCVAQIDAVLADLRATETV